MKIEVGAIQHPKTGKILEIHTNFKTPMSLSIKDTKYGTAITCTNPGLKKFLSFLSKYAFSDRQQLKIKAGENDTVTWEHNEKPPTQITSIEKQIGNIGQIKLSEVV